MAPLCSCSMPSRILGLERHCVPCWTMRPYLRAASTATGWPVVDLVCLPWRMRLFRDEPLHALAVRLGNVDGPLPIGAQHVRQRVLPRLPALLAEAPQRLAVGVQHLDPVGAAVGD